MSLHLKRMQSQVPVSLTAKLGGYEIGPVQKHFRREIWVYHLLSLPQFPLGSRDGIDQMRLLDMVIQQEITAANQGVIRLKIIHERNVFTWVGAMATLGVLTPTAVILEGDVVPVTRLKAQNSSRSPETMPGPALRQ